MNTPRKPILSTTLALLLALAMWLAATGTLNGQSSAIFAPIDRLEEPVIVAGDSLPALAGTPVNQLFVYVYSGSTWLEIPAQVDERTASGAYAALEDGLLDANDQLVLMAKDLGRRPLTATMLAGSLVISPTWYEIDVTNPLSPSQRGWAYVVRSAAMRRAPTADYVAFDPATHRITGQAYSLGFATPSPWADYLTLGSGGVDILDRTKIRVCLFNPDCLFPLTEQSALLQLQDNLVKDGPVRVILRGGRVLGYGSMLHWSIPSTATVSSIRFSIDFAPVISGAMLYHPAASGGVTIDGLPDTIPASPAASWIQVSTGTGTLIQVADLASLAGTLTNYYVDDDSNVDTSDTGDQFHYGDVGTKLSNPGGSVDYQFNIYTLPGAQPNLGEQYQAYFTTPLSVSTRLLTAVETRNRVYLPLVIK